MTGMLAMPPRTTLDEVHRQVRAHPALTAVSVAVRAAHAPVIITCADPVRAAAWAERFDAGASLIVRSDRRDNVCVRLTATDPDSGLDYVVTAPAAEIAERLIAHGGYATITPAALRTALSARRSGPHSNHRTNLNSALRTIHGYLEHEPTLHAERLWITRIADTPPVITRTPRFPRWTGNHTEIHCGSSAALLRWHDSLHHSDHTSELLLTAHHPGRGRLILRITAVLDRSAVTVVANANPLAEAFAQLPVGGKRSVRATDLTVAMTAAIAARQHRIRAELGFQGEDPS